ncbi:hypothetical protein [Morganella psychrotolerans]|uniref:hypothetical protein n=1 Tax=Morganella psychrotolerans TaxID=368603 RepID=UPI0039AFE547
MKKVICYSALTAVILMILPGCSTIKKETEFKETEFKETEFKEKSIEDCAKYLPDGIAYHVIIEGEVDLNKKFNGNINVTALQNSAPSVVFNRDVIEAGTNQYMDCAIQLLNDGKGDTRTEAEKINPAK